MAGGCDGWRRGPNRHSVRILVFGIVSDGVSFAIALEQMVRSLYTYGGPKLTFRS